MGAGQGRSGREESHAVQGCLPGRRFEQQSVRQPSARTQQKKWFVLMKDCSVVSCLQISQQKNQKKKLTEKCQSTTKVKHKCQRSAVQTSLSNRGGREEEEGNRSRTRLVMHTRTHTRLLQKPKHRQHTHTHTRTRRTLRSRGSPKKNRENR